MSNLLEARTAEVDRRLAGAERAMAEAELDRYRAACETGARPSADDLERSVEELRAATTKAA